MATRKKAEAAPPMSDLTQSFHIADERTKVLAAEVARLHARVDEAIETRHECEQAVILRAEALRKKDCTYLDSPRIFNVGNKDAVIVRFDHDAVGIEVMVADIVRGTRKD